MFAKSEAAGKRLAVRCELLGRLYDREGLFGGGLLHCSSCSFLSRRNKSFLWGMSDLCAVGCEVYGGGGIGANRGSWDGWLDCGLLKGCGAERRWSIFDQERDRVGSARNFKLKDGRL